MIWATSHRGEGMPCWKNSHDATATRLNFGGQYVRRVLVLAPQLHSRPCRDVCIACRPSVLQGGAASSAGPSRRIQWCFLTAPLLLPPARIEVLCNSAQFLDESSTHRKKAKYACNALDTESRSKGAAEGQGK